MADVCSCPIEHYTVPLAEDGGRRVLCIGWLDGYGAATVVTERNWRDNIELRLDRAKPGSESTFEDRYGSNRFGVGDLHHVETSASYVRAINADGSAQVELW